MQGKQTRNIESDPTFFLAYTKPKNFSGQTAAAELVKELLTSHGEKCVPIILFPLTRNKKGLIIGFLESFTRQLTVVPEIMRLFFSKKPVLYLNMGQSFWSFVRIGIWYFPIRLIRRQLRVVSSLHGSNFMTWESNSNILRIFLWFLKSSMIITVLGDSQKKRLENIGIKPEKIRIVPNASSMKLISDSLIRKKHNNADLSITILHLSLLIDSKGFPQYMEALEILAGRKIRHKVRAILCGPITFSPYCKQFKNYSEKKSWIENKVNSINTTPGGRVTIEWIPGASGDKKQQLYNDSHIFVFPTSFPVEAQPIVLLEALACGCNIITTKVGEIPSTLNNKCAIYLERPDPEIIANKIHDLINSPEIRTLMAIEGVKLLRSSLSVESHQASWIAIFNELTD